MFLTVSHLWLIENEKRVIFLRKFNHIVITLVVYCSFMLNSVMRQFLFRPVQDESEENENDGELVKRLNKQRRRAIAAVHRGGKTIASRNSYKDKGGRSSHNSKIQKQLSSW